MMYSEFEALFKKAKPDAPVPTIEAYVDSIEPFYMATKMDKAEFVRLYSKMPVVISDVAGEIVTWKRHVQVANDARTAAEDEARKAEAQFKETVDAMAKRQKELEERVVLLSREKNDLGDKVISLFDECDRLRKRYARLVRGLCDDCFEKVLFGERAAAETEEND